MRATRLFLLAAVLLIAGIACLFSGSHGTFGVSGGSPLRAFTIEISLSSTGAWAMAAMLATVAAIVVFVVALVRAAIAENRAAERRSGAGTQ